MKVSPDGVALLKRFEGLRLDAYQDSAGIWTIGYGTIRWSNGTAVRQGDHISAADAESMLREQLTEYERAVNEAVHVPLSQSQFDALCSLAYNIGAAAFKASTLVIRLNAGDTRGAADQFLRWVHAGGHEVEGLRRRREAERALFLSAEYTPAPAEYTPAPTPVSPPASKPMAPILAALLPSIVSMIPDLAKIFGTGTEVSNRNVAAAERVGQLVIEATKAPNLQGAIETMQADPQARQAASAAVQSAWYELVEAGGGGIDGARKFSVAAASIPAWRMPAVWVSSALLALVFMVVGTVLWGTGWKDDIKLQVVTAVLTIIGMVGSFWLGTSASSQRKTDLLADK